MNEFNNTIRKENPEGSFHRIFWEQQLEALKLSDKRQFSCPLQLSNGAYMSHQVLIMLSEAQGYSHYHQKEP